MSKDYSALQNQLKGDFAAAATLANNGSGRRIKVMKSDLNVLVPVGSTVEIEPITITKLQMGDVVCISSAKEVVLRRFIRLKMTNANTYMVLAHANSKEKEQALNSALIGKVVNVNLKGENYDPSKKENFVQALWGRLTEYGTHKAFGFIG